MAPDPRAAARKRKKVKGKLAGESARSKYRRLDLGNPLISWGLVVAFLASMMAVLAFEVSAPKPGLTDADVGTIASQDYRASKDFTYSIVDDEATLLSQDERAGQVPPIYRWNVGVMEVSHRRIQDAFAVMRDGVALVRENEASISEDAVPLPLPPTAYTLRTVWPLVAAQGSVGIAPSANAPLRTSVAAPKVEKRPLDVVIDEWLAAHRHDFNSRLLEYVDDTTFAILAHHRFSEALERDFLELVESVLRRQILADRHSIDGATLIVIQKRRGEEQLEEWLERNLGTILDADLAVQAVEEQARLRLVAWSPEDRTHLTRLAKQFVQPNLSEDVEQTETARARARESVADLVALQAFKKGEIIVDDGHKISEEHLAVYSAMVGESVPPRALWSILGLGAFLALLMAVVWVLLQRSTGRHARKGRDLLFMGVMLFGMTVVVRGGDAVLSAVSESWQLDIGSLIVVMLPFAAGSLLLRLVQDAEAAIVFAVVIALIAGLATKLAGLVVPYALISSIIGAVALNHAKTRMAILRAGMIVGAVSALCAAGLVMFQHNELRPWDLLAVGGLALTSGVLAAVMVTVMLPVAESLFGYTTDIKLLELANLENPLLKDLLLRAPGTYHHSMMVGSLNEAAADAIGANSLLARVGAYYHDIGKGKNSLYFAENQRGGENAHDKLKPNMSALVLKAHVKDGIEMARQNKLPQDLIDFIETHHGTSRIEFFYQRAREQESPDIPEVREEDYRYPGPKPQSRETGICMIADVVEAATRSMPEKTPARLKLMVHKLINGKFADGQFDECDLTLRDLNDIAESLLHILNSVYHHRPEYPDQKKEREKRERAKKGPQSAPAQDTPKASSPVERAVEAAKAAAAAANGRAKQKDGDMALDDPSLVIFDTIDPDAPVGRVRTDRSGSGEHVQAHPEGESDSPIDVSDTDESVVAVGRVRTDRSGSGEHIKAEVIADEVIESPILPGPNPSAPVGRVRTEHSTSGEHKKIDLSAIAGRGKDSA